MTRSILAALVAGIGIGAAAAAVFSLRPAARPEAASPAPHPPPPPATPSPGLLEENRSLRERIAELERHEKAASAPQSAPATPEKPPPNLRERFEGLAQKGVMAYASDDFRGLARDLKEAGGEGIELLTRILLSSASSAERFLAAGLLEAAGNPAAIPALAEALTRDEDDLVRRMASHAIAVIGTDAAEAPLRRAMDADPDWGVRVNSSYGLAKLGREDGLKMLEHSYQSTETPTEYRLAILGGLADVAAPSSAPLFHRILVESTDMASLLFAIGAVEKMKDTSALSELHRIAGSGLPSSVREAARKAINTVSGR